MLEMKTFLNASTKVSTILVTIPTLQSKTLPTRKRLTLRKMMSKTKSLSIPMEFKPKL